MYSTDMEKGRIALAAFHSASLKYDSYTPKSVDDLISLYGKKGEIYQDGIGLAVSVNNISEREAENIMFNLASVTRGRIPKDHQAYVNAIGKKAGEISYLDLTLSVSSEVAKTVAGGAQALGDSLITTGRIVNFILPALILGGLYLYFFHGKIQSTLARKK